MQKAEQVEPINTLLLEQEVVKWKNQPSEMTQHCLFFTRQGGETVEEIRRTKIKEAMKETLNVYEKLDLNMTEIEIVSRSQNVVAKVAIAKKQLETEAEERLEEQQTPMKIKIIKWMPAICSTLAIVLSIISLILRLYR